MIEQVHRIIWGPWTMALFLGVGIWFGHKSGWFQIFGIRRWWKATVGSMGKQSASQSVTSFQTACTALAATVGTGNIVGVATALTAGGPGAVLWLWVSAGIGMMTAYAETSLGIRYRYRSGEGQWICGPMVYLERGVKCPWLGISYSLFCVMASLGMGSMVQANSMAETLAYSFSVPEILAGIAAVLVILLVIRGGIGRIAYVAERLVPFSAGIYMVFSLIIIFSFYDRIPGVLRLIWESASRPLSVAGGVFGYTVSRSFRYGISRGVFSNEAGLGTLAILHGAADDATPHGQGMWAMFEVFFDTMVICTLTALVILCVTKGELSDIPYEGAALTAWCFSVRLGKWGEYVVSLSMVLFAFATMIAWYYMGRQAVSYIAGKMPGCRQCLEKLYLILYLNAIFFGCIAKVGVVWEISDIWNGLMALPNLLALILLRKEILHSLFVIDIQGDKC